MAVLDKPIRVSELGPSFKAEVIAHEAAGDITACFSCGTCTAGCPVHEIFPEYDPRKMARMVNLGMRERVLSSPYIWYCATCHTCEQCCPQNVKFFSVLNMLKNMAAKEGYPPPMSINEDMYSRCGICVAPCPSAAISVSLFEDGQLFSRIETPVA